MTRVLGMFVVLLAGCGDSTGPVPAPEARATVPAQKKAPDWDKAVSLAATRTETGAALSFEVADGFHVYGSRESTSRPLRVAVTDHPDVAVVIPEGQPKPVAGMPTPSYVLTGTIPIDVSIPDLQGPISGEVHYQVCTKSLCSMPTSREWTAE